MYIVHISKKCHMIKYRVIKFTFLIDHRRLKLGFYHTNNNIVKLGIITKFIKNKIQRQKNFITNLSNIDIMDIYFQKIVLFKFYKYHFMTTDSFFCLFLASGDIREWEKL